MNYDQELKTRLTKAQKDKAVRDASLLGKNTSEHVRDMIVEFEVVETKNGK